jgi:hypothetical protein
MQIKMNFEQLKLQIHMRNLYDRLGAQDAELMIIQAFVTEQTRHDRIHQLEADKRSRVLQP